MKAAVQRVRRRLERARTAPTSKGVALLVFSASLLLIGINTGSTWLYLLASACSMTVFVSVPWSAMPLRRARAARGGLVRATVGELVEYPVTITTSGSRIPFLVRDMATCSRPAIVEGSRAIRDVSGILRAVPSQRGVYRSPPLFAACYAPLGLWRTKREIPCTGDVEVAPPIVEVGLPAGLTAYVLHGEGTREPPKRGRGYEFFALREYLPGDPVRHIYWPATARRDKVIVREFEEEGVTPLAVFAATSPPASAAALDRVLSVAGSLVRAAVKAHIPVRLAIPGESGVSRSDPLVLDSPSAGVLRSALAAAPAPVLEEEVVNAFRACRRLPMAAVVGVKPARAPWPSGVQGALDFAVIVLDEQLIGPIEGALPGARTWVVSPRGDICFEDFWRASAA